MGAVLPLPYRILGIIATDQCSARCCLRTVVLAQPSLRTSLVLAATQAECQGGFDFPLWTRRERTLPTIFSERSTTANQQQAQQGPRTSRAYGANREPD